MQLRAAVDPGQFTAAPDGDRVCAERLHGLAADTGRRADSLTGQVGGLIPRLAHAEPLQRAGQDRDAAHARLLDGIEHLPGDRTPQHLLLGRVVGHRERRDQRIERPNALGPERARPDPGEIDLAGAHVVEDARLSIGFALAPAVDELDPQPPVRGPFHRPGERLDLSRRVVEVGKPQDPILTAGRTARLVGAHTTAPGKQRRGAQQQREDGS